MQSAGTGQAQADAAVTHNVNLVNAKVRAVMNILFREYIEARRRGDTLTGTLFELDKIVRSLTKDKPELFDKIEAAVCKQTKWEDIGRSNLKGYEWMAAFMQDAKFLAALNEKLLNAGCHINGSNVNIGPIHGDATCHPLKLTDILIKVASENGDKDVVAGSEEHVQQMAYNLCQEMMRNKQFSSAQEAQTTFCKTYMKVFESMTKQLKEKAAVMGGDIPVASYWDVFFSCKPKTTDERASIVGAYNVKAYGKTSLASVQISSMGPAMMQTYDPIRQDQLQGGVKWKQKADGTYEQNVHPFKFKETSTEFSDKALSIKRKADDRGDDNAMPVDEVVDNSAPALIQETLPLNVDKKDLEFGGSFATILTFPMTRRPKPVSIPSQSRGCALRGAPQTKGISHGKKHQDNARPAKMPRWTAAQVGLADETIDSLAPLKIDTEDELVLHAMAVLKTMLMVFMDMPEELQDIENLTEQDLAKIDEDRWRAIAFDAWIKLLSGIDLIWRDFGKIGEHVKAGSIFDHSKLVYDPKNADAKAAMTASVAHVQAVFPPGAIPPDFKKMIVDGALEACDATEKKTEAGDTASGTAAAGDVASGTAGAGDTASGTAAAGDVAVEVTDVAGKISKHDFESSCPPIDKFIQQETADHVEVKVFFYEDYHDEEGTLVQSATLQKLLDETLAPDNMQLSKAELMHKFPILDIANKHGGVGLYNGVLAYVLPRDDYNGGFFRVKLTNTSSVQMEVVTTDADGDEGIEDIASGQEKELHVSRVEDHDMIQICFGGDPSNKLKIYLMYTDAMHAQFAM